MDKREYMTLLKIVDDQYRRLEESGILQEVQKAVDELHKSGMLKDLPRYAEASQSVQHEMDMINALFDGSQSVVKEGDMDVRTLGTPISSPRANVDKSTSISPPNVDDVNRELSVAHTIISKLKKRMKFSNRPVKEELRALADSCRFKNGTINYSKLGKGILGVSNKTAKSWCDDYKIF
jgi:hypothetical protein